MYRIISASKDAYITNKIINSKFRATDANTGQAGSLDLFKLYAENISGSDTTPTEFSRLLIKFDLDDVTTMHNNKIIDVGDASFKAELNLHDIYGGQTTPNNFHMIAFPLAKKFDEGAGFDVVKYTDLDATNWLTGSYTTVASPATATATLTVADGDDDTAAELPAEKTTIKIISTDGTSKTYVIVDDNATTVATGDVLASDSDTGSSTAGDALVGGIAVAINLTGTVSTQANVLNQLRLAIINSNGHDSKITVSSALIATNGSQAITLTQAITGYPGNTIIVNGLVKVTSTEFTGGTNGIEAWHLPGAMRSGSLGSSNIDVITSGTITGQAAAINLAPVQYFETGEEDLKVDVTSFVSASVKGLITNNGFLVGFSGSYEKDAYSYFVKRFASRNTTNTAIRPKLIIKFNDAIQDNHQNFEFDITGSLHLNNFNRGSLANIISGSSATSLTGENCMILKVQTGSFSKQFDVSQALRGSTTKSTATLTFSDRPAEERQIILKDVEDTTVIFELDNDNDGATDAIKATAEWIFTDKPNEQTTITIVDYEGTSVVFEVDNDGNGAAGSNVAMDPATNNGAGMATIMTSVVNASALNITATNPESGKVVLTQDAGAAAGNKTISFSDRSNWVANTEPDVPTAFTGGAAASIIPMKPAANNVAAMAAIMVSSVNGSSLKITATNPSGGVVLLTQDIPGPLGDINITSNLNNASVPASFSGGAYAGLTGIYSASFAISSFDTSLYDHVLTSGSITFDEIWSNRNETVTYLSASLKINKNNISSINFRENRYLVSMINLKQRYRQAEYSRLRVFAENADRTITFSKTPIEKPSEIFSNMHYRVRDFGSGNIIVPFDTSSNSTKLSSDNIGMYFDFYMSSLPRGRAYVFDYLIKQNSFDVVIKDTASKFIIE
jgi:hypothetical protein